MFILAFIISILLAYFLGGLNFAIIITKIKSGKDIRDFGSGNAGLTNTLRTQGKLAALFVLLGDVSKGIISVLLTRLFFWLLTGIDVFDVAQNQYYILYLATVATTLGHIFPPLYHFKGGKGILVTATALCIIEPWSALILIATFAIFTGTTRYVSLGSCMAAGLFPITTFIFRYLANDSTIWISVAVAIPLGLYIIYKHKDNIKRLRSGIEKKLGQKE